MLLLASCMDRQGSCEEHAGRHPAKVGLMRRDEAPVTPLSTLQAHLNCDGTITLIRLFKDTHKDSAEDPMPTLHTPYTSMQTYLEGG